MGDFAPAPGGGVPPARVAALTGRAGIPPGLLAALRREGQRLAEAGEDDPARARDEALRMVYAEVFAGGEIDGERLDVEALCSLHERLIALSPVIEGGRFALDGGTGASQRRSSGSYYTPAPLAELLLDCALEPVIAEAVAVAGEDPEAQAAAVLRLRIVDPACGAGHLLIAAARRLAGHVARLRGRADGQAGEALREAVARCVYGVELSPLAAMLCRERLRRAAGLSVGALEATIREGDALVGAGRAMVARGIDPEGWGRAARQQHRAAQARGARAEWAGDLDLEAAAARADLWCAGALWEGEEEREGEAAPTLAAWEALAGEGVPGSVAAAVGRLRARYRFFHWELGFREVIGAGGFDAVIGNPPYLNQLESRTAAGPGLRGFLRRRYPGVKQAYTNIATLFWSLGLEIVRPGGRIALVQPLSLFAAKDARPTRRALAEGGRLTALWVTPSCSFPGVLIHVCLVAVERAGSDQARRGLVRRWSGDLLEEAAPVEADMAALAREEAWGGLIADLIGVPAVAPRGEGALSDLATTTADFRDEFYGLIPFVREAAPSEPPEALSPLVVTGLIDPAAMRWGERPCRFGKRAWSRPVVDAARLEAEGPAWLAGWLRARRLPKVVVATQGRVIEAAADRAGAWVNTVPTITVIPRDPADLWRVLAVLLAPPVSALALSRYAGAALSAQGLKLSAAQLRQIPLPVDRGAWDRAAEILASSSPEDDRSALTEAAAHMCDAYRVEREPVLSWWERASAPDPT